MYFRELQETIFGENFPWNYNEGTTTGKDGDIYFTHMGFKTDPEGRENPFNSPFYFDAKPVLYFIEEKCNFHISDLLRINCTMVVRQPKVETSAFHTDYSFPHYTGILYMNDCNGPTVFDEGLKIEFRTNRFALFDGTIHHAASQQSDAARRVNVVFNMQGYFK